VKSKVILDCRGFIDRRGPRELEAARALEQARADKALQERFDEGVRRREGRRLLSQPVYLPTALEHALTAPAVLRRQA
jgi:hypothetical protein